MALTAPSSTLTGQTIAASYDQVLFLDAAAGVTEATLKIVSGTAGKTALQISDEHVLIKGVDTSNAAAFAVHTTGGALIFGVAADTPAITIGVDDTGADVRVYSATASEGLLYDASEDELGLLLTTKLKFHDIGGGEEIYASANGHLEINSGTTLDITAPTVDVNASTAVTLDTPAVTFSASNSSAAVTLTIQNTNNPSEGETDQAVAIDFKLTHPTNTQITAAKIHIGKEDDWNPSGQSDSFMAFYTTNATTSTEKMRIESGGNVEVKTGNLVIGTDGKGIDFSAQTAASASGASATAELLDHYEEGTWTPVLKDASDNGITSYHQNDGTYTRVGRAVSISGAIYCNDVSGPSGNLQLEGLPFTCVTTTAVAFGELRRTDRGSGNHTLIGNVPATTAYIALGVNDGDGTNNTGGLDASKIMTATQWHFSATYPV